MNYFAYLDAGTGSIIIQAVIGAGLGIMVVMRTHIGSFLKRLSGGRKQTSEQEEQEA